MKHCLPFQPAGAGRWGTGNCYYGKHPTYTHSYTRILMWPLQLLFPTHTYSLAERKHTLNLLVETHQRTFIIPDYLAIYKTFIFSHISWRAYCPMRRILGEFTFFFSTWLISLHTSPNTSDEKCNNYCNGSTWNVVEAKIGLHNMRVW